MQKLYSYALLITALLHCSEMRLAAEQATESAESAESDLVERLRDSDPTARRDAAMALSRMGDGAKFAVPQLTIALQDDDADVSVLAAMALGRIGPPARAAVPSLVAALSDKRTASFGSVPAGFVKVESSAALALHRIGADSVAAVAPLLESKDEETQRLAMSIISGGGDAAEPHLKHLLQGLKHESEKTRSTAVDALGALAIRADVTVPALAEYLSSENDTNLRISTLLSLSRFGPDAAQVLPKIVELLRDEDSTLRGFAAYALGEMRGAARGAIPELRKLFDDRGPVFNRYPVLELEMTGKVGTWAKRASDKIESSDTIKPE